MPQPLPELSLADLQDNDPQTLADNLSTPVIWCDHQVTRRQRLHGLNIPGKRQVFSSTHLAEVLEQADKEGFVDAILICQTPAASHVACYITYHTLHGQQEHETQSAGKKRV